MTFGTIVLVIAGFYAGCTGTVVALATSLREGARPALVTMQRQGKEIPLKYSVDLQCTAADGARHYVGPKWLYVDQLRVTKAVGK